MTKNVLVRITGLQTVENEDETDPIEVIAPGSYLWKDGVHYIRYEEMSDDPAGTTRNLIKLRDHYMEVTRKGISNSHLVFEEQKKNISYYETPCGNLRVGITARTIDMQEDESSISANVSYALDINYEHLADCRIRLRVCPQGAERLL